MFCENSLKWIVSAKNGIPHKFGIDVKHKTHYILGIKASQLCESKHKHLCIHLICMSYGPMVFQGTKIVGFLYQVDPIDHQSTTQLMFHTLKCKGICFFYYVVHKSQLCWNIHSLYGLSTWMQRIGVQGNCFLHYLFVVAFQLQFLVLMKLWQFPLGFFNTSARSICSFSIEVVGHN